MNRFLFMLITTILWLLLLYTQVPVSSQPLESGPVGGSHPIFVEDSAYNATWNGDEDPTSKNTLYDYLVNFDSDCDGSYIDELWYIAVLEVEDEIFNAANFNGDTTHAVSQDDFYDRVGVYDTDYDGDIDSVDPSVADNVDQTTLLVPGGSVSLDVGDDLSDAEIEVVNITGAAPVNLSSISDGVVGQIKYFIAGDGNITLVNDPIGVVGGVFRLNQAPGAGTLSLSAGDVVAFVNIGGSNGYWKELFRTLYVG